MFRSSAAVRGALRSVNAASRTTSRTVRTSTTGPLRSQLSALSRRPDGLALAKPLASPTLQLVRYQSRGPMDTINKEAEAKIGEQKLKADPGMVSTQSSTHPVLGEVGGESGEKETEMLAGVKSDLQTIRDTFSLEGVPREAYYIGLAGVLPYLATSLSTVYCAWEINHAAAAGTGLILSEKSAEILLHILEPLQIGYGATIISFLGAIHWGLEWAKFGGEKGYPRYMIGVVSTGLAWPTILLPVEYALISQFLIFNFLYYSDSRATKRGWAPSWYAVYRFVLTFIVGSSIVVSLVGRGQIADRVGRLPGPADKIRELRESQFQQLEEEEEARRKYLAKEDEEAAEDEAEDETEGEGEGEGGDDKE